MANRTDQPPEQPTPVAEDINASAPQLLARAGVDYRRAQARRDRLSREDRVNGHATGSTV